MSRLGWLGSRPWLHFILLGAVLYFLDGQLLDAHRTQKVLRVELSEEDVAGLAYDSWRSSGRAPSEDEIERLVQQRVDDELLLQAALAQGWNRSDAVVRQRLVRNQRFLRPESSQDDGELLEIAYQQGMDRGDIVVRRRLIQRMRMAIGATARTQEPEESELQSYRRERLAEFERPARVALTQIYLSRDTRGESLAVDAEELGRRLRDEGVTPDGAAILSDPILLPTRLNLWSETTLAGRFGPDFAAAAMEAALGAWSGPVGSSYGLHFIWVHDREAARTPPLDEIRREVRAALLEQREQRAVRSALQRLRNDAEISVARPPVALPEPAPR